MKHQVKKIEILTEQGFNNLIEKHDFERFSCSCDERTETDNILRIAIYSNKDLFDELTEQPSNSDVGFMAFGGTKENLHYVAIELVL